MRTRSNLLAAASASLLLSACSTVFDVDVPDTELIKACVEDPSKSYKPRVPAPATNALFISTEASNVTLPGTFITSKELGTFSADVDFPDESKRVGSLINALSEKSNSEDPLEFLNRDKMLQQLKEQHSTLVSQGNEIWNSSVHQELMTTYNELVTSSEAPEKKFDVNELAAYQDALKDFGLRGGWFVYSYSAFAQIENISAQKDLTPEGRNLVTKALMQKATAGILVHAYLKAYFRNGQFVRVDWELGNPFLKALEALPADVRQTLEDIIPTAMLEKYNAELEKHLKGQIGKIADAGFVSRGGEALAIPPLTAKFDADEDSNFSLSKLEPELVGADIVRVTFEALGDALNRIPATSEATGITSKILVEAGKQLPDAGRIKIEGKKPPKVEDVMTNVESLSGQAHGVVSAGVGSAIRGINVAALNNEAVAKILESTAGTIVRKATERIAWCWYASIPAEENTKALSFIAQPAKWNSITIKVAY